VPRPDLSYTNLDGLVDFGTTTLKVDVPENGDSLSTKMKGRIAIVGGACAGQECQLQVVLVDLRSIQNNLTTAKGKAVSGVIARNANIWTGKKLNDGTIVMSATNLLALEATIDGKKVAALLNPNAWFTGRIYYEQVRSTDAGPRQNNRLSISGNFADKHVQAWLTISIWATNCQPVIEPHVERVPGIETVDPGHLLLTSKFERLANMQNSQSLCDALMAADPLTACTAGGSSEFPRFTCAEQPLPPATTPAEVAKQLKFRWRDATGYVFADRYMAILDEMPPYPLTLEVENKWGKTATATLVTPPQGGRWPKPTSLRAYGVTSGAGKKESGTANWSYSFDRAARRYEVAISGESYHSLDYATVVTPTFGAGRRGFCTTGSANGKLTIECYDDKGHEVVPASVSFVTYGQ
jgi:hypothetical protein